MSREIGFRVWSENRKRFLETYEADYEHAIMYACNSSSGAKVEAPDDTFIIEQDTGLKDKNDKQMKYLVQYDYEEYGDEYDILTEEELEKRFFVVREGENND